MTIKLTTARPRRLARALLSGQASIDALNLRQAGEQLQISPDAVFRLIKSGVIAAKQIVRYAPWMIPRAELEKISVCTAVASIKQNGKAKIEINQQQLNL